MILWASLKVGLSLGLLLLGNRLKSDTRVVFIFADLEFDELLTLLEDLNSFLHGAVLHTDVINGQQLVSQLQRPCPENTFR